MGRKLCVLLLVAAVLGLAQPVWGDDGFYVIAGSRGVGTPITPTTSLPCTISQPGFYYLTGNLNSSGDAIIIGISEVTFDLMGFSITGPGSSSGTGVNISSGINNVQVRNGAVKNFSTGVNAAPNGSNRHLANLMVSGCHTGIHDTSSTSIITNCQASGNGSGIRADGAGGSGMILDKNTANNNAAEGFFIDMPTGNGGLITNNVAYKNATGFFFRQGCRGRHVG